MTVTVGIGACIATIETDHDVTPEVALDLLNRCADAALRVYAGLPDSSE
jgi:hypothetical protein